ncbi:conjugal transfer protein TraI [Pedobacter sp. ASV28]|uniref:conjugal transfer protein TraI n=1 Tax=Pedobacter sp. ASV28 TaxID=2795123 RepID=UPI0018ED9CA5|nr:conjugal transfer protein TraI [Pedobacter sp. ASV28]
MKRYVCIMFLACGLIIGSSLSCRAQAEVITATVKKVLRAIDLKIQREQNKVIWLQNAQKTIENIMSKLKLEEIGDWVERQKNIYKDYFDELHKVKTLITYYQQIRNITGKQVQLVEEYKRAWQMVKKDKNFTADEVTYMGRVYEGILNETVQNIDQLAIVINSFATQMSDAKRMEIISNVDNQVDLNLKDLRKFNTENALLSLNRAKSESEIKMVKDLYGIKN